MGPALFINLLTSLMLANVPRDMTASLPRREPYELNSLGVNLGVRREKAEYSILYKNALQNMFKS